MSMGRKVSLTVAITVVTVATATVLSLAAEKHWGYDYNSTTAGPTQWGSLPGDELCSFGKEQSPINIKTKKVKNGSNEPALEFHYQGVPLDVVNNGHTIQQDYPAGSGSTLKIGDQTLSLKQFHFHAPSENQIDGKTYPLELHFVHVNENGDPVAVVAVFLKEGSHNLALDPIFSNLPPKKGEREKSEVTQVFASKLLPDDFTYFHFKGSLTTPPCSEGVDWYVLREPISLDSLQIKAFTSIPGFSNISRPIQPLGRRVVTLKETEVSHPTK